MRREEKLDFYRTNPEISVLIVGGGVNGAGLLRELALNGVDALLVEKGDYCSGTSAASTRVIHGGLRYLENGEFRLVREALLERNRLLRNAPHYVRPLPTTIPIFNWTGGVAHILKKMLRIKSKPGGRGALIVKAGLTLYDLLTLKGRALPTHRFTSRQQALTDRPQLTPNIVCTATYYDASVTHPERLCLELILDAEAASPNVHALNYVRLESASGDTVTLHDEISGASFTVKPKIVVNATGAWIDLTNHAMHRDTRLIGGTKGSHLVLDHPELHAATRGEMLYFENADGRICIFYPFFDRVIAGATDIPFDDPDKAICDDEEADYILESIRAVFPKININRSHIVFRFSGVRPLPRSSAATTGQISRDHSLQITPAGNDLTFPIYSLVGGKWTTFRAFAEQVANQIFHTLNQQRIANSADLPIGGGKTSTTALDTGVIDYAQKEILHRMIESEHIQHVDDILLRRTLIGILGNTTYPLVVEMAEILGAELGWTQTQIDAEVARTLQILAARHDITLTPIASARTGA